MHASVVGRYGQTWVEAGLLFFGALPLKTVGNEDLHAALLQSLDRRLAKALGHQQTTCNKTKMTGSILPLQWPGGATPMLE